MSNRRRNTKQLAQTPVVATQEFIPRSDTKMEAFSFGDPSPVLTTPNTSWNRMMCKNSQWSSSVRNWLRKAACSGLYCKW